MYVLIKDLRRSGVHVCANKGLSGKSPSQAPAVAGPGVFGRGVHLFTLRGRRAYGPGLELSVAHVLRT